MRVQAQKLVDELVARGEITAEEAQKMVNDMVNRAQTEASAPSSEPLQPRRIEILDDDEPDSPTAAEAQQAALRQQVEALRQELEQLKRQP